MSIRVIENGYLVERDGIPVRYFAQVGDAMKFDDQEKLDRVCPSTGETCQHLTKVCTTDRDPIIVWTCDMTGHEVDRGYCPLHDPIPRMPL
jgi:hypothetical protein